MSLSWPLLNLLFEPGSFWCTVPLGYGKAGDYCQAITALPVDLVTLQKIHSGVTSCSYLLFDHLITLCEE